MYMIQDSKSQILARFDMKYLRAAKYILMVEFTRDKTNRNIWLSQSNYLNSMLQHFAL